MRKKCTFDNHRIFHSCHISGTRGRPLGEEKEKYRGVDLAKLYLSSFLHCCFFKNFSFSFLLKNSVSTFRNWWVIITALEALIPTAQNLILFFRIFHLRQFQYSTFYFSFFLFIFLLLFVAAINSFQKIVTEFVEMRCVLRAEYFPSPFAHF